MSSVGSQLVVCALLNKGVTSYVDQQTCKLGNEREVKKSGEAVSVHSTGTLVLMCNVYVSKTTALYDHIIIV